MKHIISAIIIFSFSSVKGQEKESEFKFKYIEYGKLYYNDNEFEINLIHTVNPDSLVRNSSNNIYIHFSKLSNFETGVNYKTIVDKTDTLELRDYPKLIDDMKKFNKLDISQYQQYMDVYYLVQIKITTSVDSFVISITCIKNEMIDNLLKYIAKSILSTENKSIIDKLLMMNHEAP